MAEDKGNTAVNRPHDKVAMLSLKADGTPDQTDPEIIGEREFAEAATREQFRQQAVSAVDEAKRAELLPSGDAAGEVEQDPKIAELKDAHDKAADAATKAADATVDNLFTGDKPAATSTATPASTAGQGDASKTRR